MIKIEGAAEFERLSILLRKMGRGELASRMRKELRREVVQVGPAVVLAMPQYLPDRYALALGPASKFDVSTRTTGGNVWVRLSMRATGEGVEDRDIPKINSGILKKPVFGRYRMTKSGLKANPWVAQRVRPGFFDDPAEQRLGSIQNAALDVLESIARDLAND